MRLSISAVAATAACAHAFKNTSPFVMFSDSTLPTDLQNSSTLQLQSSQSVLKTAKAFLSTCPSSIYIILAQPSLLSSDVASSPHLRKAVGDKSVKGRWSVNEVVGMTVEDGGELVDFVRKKCGAKRFTLREWEKNMKREEKESIIVNGVMPAIDGERKRSVEEADSKLFNILNTLPGTSYTVIYHTTPVSDIKTSTPTESKVVGNVYESKFMEPLHMDLKRNLWARGRDETNSTDLRPLFEKYNFLSPGLFMGLSVSLLLLSILWVGISAISSLEVSYGAFDKDMGPSAQKKP